MTTIKSYTDIFQSKKLEEILPLESADMYYEKGIGDKYRIDFGNYADISISKNLLHIDAFPCWSLAALLKIIKYYDIEADDGIIIKRKLCYEPYQITTQKHNDIIDACIEMILKLKENELI